MSRKGRKGHKANTIRFWRFVLVAVVVVFGTGALLALAGCRNRPVVDRHGNVHILGDLTVEGTITGTEITITGDGDFGGTVTAEAVVAEVVQIPPLPPTPPTPQPPLPVCGNWVIESGEQCDRLNFGNQTCLGYDDFAGGYLVCDTNCKINFDQCTRSPPDDEPTPLVVTLLPPFVGLEQEGNPPANCVTFTVGDFEIEVEGSIRGGVAPFSVVFRNYYGFSQTVEVGEEGEFSFFLIVSNPTTKCVSSEIKVTDANGEKRNIFFYNEAR